MFESFSSKKVKIGIDARVLQKPLAGVGKYVSEICQCLDYLLPNASFFLISNKNIDWDVPSKRWVFSIDQCWGNLSSLVWLKFFSSKFISQLDLDVFWGTAHFLPNINVPTVLTVHDLVHIYAPETMSSKLLWGHRIFMKKDVKKAKSVMAVSQGTADKLEKFVKHKVVCDIAHPAVSKNFKPALDSEKIKVCNKYDISGSFFLMVATAEPRKNIINTILAFNELKLSGKVKKDTSLVLVGGDGWKNKEIKDTVASCKSTIAIGYVPDEDLSIIYSAASCFLFFSMYEGFGMPIREALCCGTCVMTSNTTETKEAGCDKAFYFNTDVESIKKAMMWFDRNEKAINSVGNVSFDDSWHSSAKKYAEQFIGVVR